MGFFISWLLFVLLVVGSWFVNLTKLVDCDFKSPYRCEVIHGVGLVPIIAVFTAWVDTNEQP